jgi:predicted patatin/cPLA2 family phospholipase
LDKQEEHLIPDTMNIYTTLEAIIVTPGYSNHILNTGHAYGTVTDTMDIITTGRKGKHLNTLEWYHMYKTSRENLHMNDTYKDTYNPIFEALQEIYTK